LNDPLGRAGRQRLGRERRVRAADAVGAQARKRGIKAPQLADAIGRPQSSLPKLVDEYYWVTVTNGLAVPSRRELARWLTWA